MLTRIKTWFASLSPDEWRLIELARAARDLLSSSGALVMALLDRLPGLVAQIRVAEAAHPLPGSGSRKLTDVLSWLEREHGSALRQVASWAATVQAVRALVSVLVTALNLTGVLRHEETRQ